MQTETDCAAIVNVHENQENSCGQKLSHLFFVRHSLCQTTSNKEGATVITLFLPSGFSRVSTRKTRQPRLSQFDPKGVQLHLRTLKTWPRAHSSTSGRVWPSLTEFDQSWPSLTEVWPRPWLDQRQDLTNHPLTTVESTLVASIRYFMGRKQVRNKKVIGKTVKIGPTLS